MSTFAPLAAPAPASLRPAQLRLDGVTVDYGARPILTNLSVEFRAGAVTVIVGANGCGKSTLLRTSGRLLTPRRGTVTLDGEDLHRTSTRAVARRLGFLPQHPTAPDGIVVYELVARGRFPHRGLFQPWRQSDTAAVARALIATRTAELRDRPLAQLSGGQRQRAWLAVALAGEPDVLLLDEPTTYLDLRHQLEILDVLADLNQTHGTTVVMVLHDVNLAARYANDLIAMADGEVVAQGPPDAVLTPALVARVLGVDAVINRDPATGRPWVLPLGPSSPSTSDGTQP